MNAYQKYAKAAQARAFFTEYANLARLVDDLDIRFWKRFVTRGSMRQDSIDHSIDEDTLRKEYQSCVSDLIVMRKAVEAALESISDDLCRSIIRERYIHGMDEESIAEKWQLDEWKVYSLIQQGFVEAFLPEKHG